MSDQTVVVAVEDTSTAGVVAQQAAHVVMDEKAGRVVLLHVLDHHIVANGFFGLVGSPIPAVERDEEGDAVLALAEAAFRAEFTACEQEPPGVSHEFVEGRPGQAIVDVAAQRNACAIVVGARRPHAFGRLTHPDVTGYLRHHTEIPVHIVSLQAEPGAAEAP